jgi:cytoskeletal protein CcmA (bactofilin family)
MNTLPLLLAASWLVPTYALGQLAKDNQFQAREQVIINHPIDHDLYTAGEKILINAPIRGDLVAAGGTVIVRDSIYEDLTLAGGDLTVDGPVADDVLALGGTASLRRSVQGDVIVLGGEVKTTSSSLIENNLVVMGGDVEVDGDVAGSVTVWGGEVTLNGTCQKNLDVKGGEVTVNGTIRGTSVLAAETITLGPDAQLFGNVRYWVPEEADAPDFTAAMAGGTARYDPSLDVATEFPWFDWSPPGFSIALAYLLAVVLMIVLIQWLFSAPLEQAGAALREDFMRCFGYGVLYLLGVPLLIGLLFITIIGIPPGLFILFLYGFSIAFGLIITASVATYALRYHYKMNWNLGMRIFVSFVIFAVLRVLTFTPLVGLFLSVVAVGAALGALVVPHLRRAKPVIA